jgi:hypothetical protein
VWWVDLRGGSGCGAAPRMLVGLKGRPCSASDAPGRRFGLEESVVSQQCPQDVDAAA